MARYVNADDIWKEACKRFEFVDDFMEVLDAVPTADVRENEHVEWQYGENAIGQDGYYCSHCGRFVPWEYGKVGINFIYRFFFCPNCGANMRGEEDGM